MILHDDASLGSSVAATMIACGFEHIDSVRAPSMGTVVAARTKPDVIVVDIELAGSRGVGIVPALLAAAPESFIIVLSQFENLRFPTLEAGAMAFIGKSDLRELRGCLTNLAKPGDDHTP